MVISGVGVALTGDRQAKLMFEQQPMKMAAAEALCETASRCRFSILAIGDLSRATTARASPTSSRCPGSPASWRPATSPPPCQGTDQLQQQYEERYGDTDATASRSTTPRTSP